MILMYCCLLMLLLLENVIGNYITECYILITDLHIFEGPGSIGAHRRVN